MDLTIHNHPTDLHMGSRHSLNTVLNTDFVPCCPNNERAQCANVSPAVSRAISLLGIGQIEEGGIIGYSRVDV